MLISKKKPKTFFYGWTMLAIAMIGSIMTTPGQTAGVRLFNPSFAADLNLTQTQLTGAYAMGTFLASLSMTYVGAQMDRFGIRRVMGIVVVLFGIVCAFTGLVTGFWTLFLAFLFLRMFGQGSLTLLSQNTAAMWFDKRLGLANSMIAIGFSLASAATPPFLFWLISSFGWRVAYPILGGIVVVVMLPLVILFYVNRPEELDQQMDGGWVGEANPNAEQPSAYSFTLQEAMKTPAYWIISGFMFSISMIGTAIAFNALFLFSEFGLTDQEAIAVLATTGFTSAIAQLFAGWLADVVPLRWLMVFNAVGQTAAIILLLFISSVWTATIFAIVAGIFNAIHQGAIGPLWARYYGREHIGKIRGSTFTATVAGSSLGPFVMGYLFDVTGSYTPSILIFVGIYATFVALTPFAKRPQPITAL
ncbi:MAG: MFS transporter [Anaerolineae bacterium]